MRALKLLIPVFAWLVAFAVMGTAFSWSSETSVPTRKFRFTYLTTLPSVRSGAKSAQVWIPLPQSGPYQTIDDVKIEAPFTYTQRREAEYGNEYLYFDVPASKVSHAVEVRLSFEATRREHRVALDAPVTAQHRPASPDLQRFLEPDRLVPLQGTIAEASTQETHGLQDPLAKARAIYNYVVATMRYDKSGTGWGNGDAIWACTAKRGNCTDFHSLLIGMMRAAGIPARFEIGFPLPTDQHDGTLPGYHCWAEFYVEPYGWIPVDASEAWKHPDKKDYFFGAHDDNRVQFTLGRDIRLDPPQQAGPLNYFIYPYAELDGKPIALTTKFTFQDE